MGRAQITLGVMLAMCVGAGACSTESAVQRDNNPATGNTGEPLDDDAGTGINGGDAGGGGSGVANGGGAVPGNGGGGGTGSDGGTLVCEPGPTKGSSVLLIGDSYVDINNKAFGKELQRLAKAAGSLAANDKYSDRSVSGTQLVGGFLGTPIPGQYANEKNSDGHVKTVIMDGGGNDVLLGNRGCITTQAPPESKSCVDTINGAMAAAKTLLAQMAKDGVEDVVYFFYPHLPGDGLGGDKELSNKTVDYAVPLVKKTCEEAEGLRCVFVDTRGLFGTAASDFQDGIHPTVANINKIAGAVWQTMQAECIAQ